MLSVGEKFPPFVLNGVNENNEFVQVSVDEGYTPLKNDWSVIYFYPKDFTFICPTEIAGMDLLVDEANVIYQNTLKAMNELTETQELDPDGLDIAVSASNRELSLRIADRERKMLNKIRTSMGRLKEGEYGSCSECGDPIGYPRLMLSIICEILVSTLALTR